MRHPLLPTLCFALFLAVVESKAGAISTIYDGGVAVGTLKSSVDATGFESASFTLNSAFRSLMSDAQGNQFRFFQVIYYDDEPTTWLGKIITPASAPAHSGTVVDTPAGGWDYELPGGDDFVPFYESDTANNPVTNQPYAFPTLSYPSLHSPDRQNPGTSSTLDAPGLVNPNHQTLFETFLVYYTPALAATRTFDVLGGFQWGVQTDALANQTGIDSVNLNAAALSPPGIAELSGALARSGFQGWTAQVVSAFAPLPVPEPGTGMVVFASVFLLSVARRVRSRRS